MLYDIAVIGGGAAGLCAAVYAKMSNQKLNIVILEALDRVGKKLITTGNGRCNITNKFTDISRYHSNDIESVEKIINHYGVNDTVKFFSDLGVEIVFSQDGRGYPSSYQASSVVDVLRFACDEYGITIKCDTKVLDISFNQFFCISTEHGDIKSRTVIVTGGLYSGDKKCGSNGSVFEILKSKGFDTVKTTPSLVQLKVADMLPKKLKGIKTDAKVKLIRNNKICRQEQGEVLFTEYGLSGPPILQMSRETSRGGKYFVSLDLLPHLDIEELKNKLFLRRKNLKKRATEDFLTGFINKRIGQMLLKLCNISLADSVQNISDSDIINLCKIIKDLSFEVSGNTGFINSQVTAGGISLSEFDSNTLQSLKFRGMFAAGELLDVDGDCGGFNLQWAWSSAMLAAHNACNYLKGL